MNTKHTQGEWVSKGCEIYNLNTGKTIARTDIGGTDEQTEANARLIAAAPELLEALEDILRKMNLLILPTERRNSKIYQQAKQAINKAKGI